MRVQTGSEMDAQGLLSSQSSWEDYLKNVITRPHLDIRKLQSFPINHLSIDRCSPVFALIQLSQS